MSQVKKMYQPQFIYFFDNVQQETVYSDQNPAIWITYNRDIPVD